MTREEAAAVLGLPADCSPEEVEAQFRKLANAVHPDVGGDSDAMARLSAARDMLARGPSKALIAVEDIAPLIFATQSAQVAHEERKTTAVSAQQRVVRLLTNRPRAIRRTMGVLGAGSAALSLISTQILPQLSLGPEVGVNGTAITLALAIVSAALGLQYWLLDTRVKRLEDDAALLDENLSDKEFLISVLNASLRKGWQQAGFSRSELVGGLRTERGGDRYPRHLSPFDVLGLHSHHMDLDDIASRIGPDEVARLVIAKGLSTGVLEEADSTDEESAAVRYVRRNSKRP